VSVLTGPVRLDRRGAVPIESGASHTIADELRRTTEGQGTDGADGARGVRRHSDTAHLLKREVRAVAVESAPFDIRITGRRVRDANAILEGAAIGTATCIRCMSGHHEPRKWRGDDVGLPHPGVTWRTGQQQHRKQSRKRERRASPNLLHGSFAWVDPNDGTEALITTSEDGADLPSSSLIRTRLRCDFRVPTLLSIAL
jgi:hypothetical protein